MFFVKPLLVRAFAVSVSTPDQLPSALEFVAWSHLVHEHCPSAAELDVKGALLSGGGSRVFYSLEGVGKLAPRRRMT